MVTSNRPQGGNQGGSGGDNTTASNYTNTAGDYGDPDYYQDHDGDMDGMHYDHDGVLRRERMASRSTRTGATWEGESSSPYGEEWDEEDMEPSKFRSKARGIARGRGRSGGYSKRGSAGYGQGNGGGDAIHELIPIYIPTPGMDSTYSSGSDPDGISGDTLAVIINNGESHEKGEKRMFSGMGNDNGFLAGLLAGGGGNKGGVDASTLAYLGQCKDNGMWGGDSLALIILLLLLGAGGRGFGGLGGGYGGNGGDCCAGMLSEKNTGLVLDAIGTNGIRQESAINALAGNLNCDVNSIKSTLCSLAQNQAVMSGDIKSAIASCCCNLQGKIDSCCCTTNNNIARESAAIQLGVERQGCDIKSELSGINYNLASQFAAQNNMMQMIAAQQERQLADCCCEMKQQVQAGFDGLARRELEQEIQRLRDERDNQRTSAQTAFLLQAIRNSRSFTGNLDATTGDFTGLVAGQTGQFTI